MSSLPLHVTPLAARRFQRRALLLDHPVADVGAALAHHGYVQIDPLNVCGRMHDLILRNRVTAYREGDLMRHLYGDDAPLPAARRVAFEHHVPATGILVAFPLEAWPHLRAAMLDRTRRDSAWSGRLTAAERRLVPRLLDAIGERGPLGSEAFADTPRAPQFWGQATLAKSTLQKLFFHGRLLIAARNRNRRLYDLPERVLPSDILHAPPPTAAATARWEVLLKLRQRRLVTLSRAELSHVEDQVHPVKIESLPNLHCLRADLPHWDLIDSPNSKIENSTPRLLAPLDPLIYDRRLTSRLWDFDYTWEVYTPEAKRVRGYYALPVLAGDAFVGHIEPRADRPAGRLRVISRSVRRGHRTTQAVQDLAQFLGLR